MKGLILLRGLPVAALFLYSEPPPQAAPAAGLSGSKHDFSQEAWAGGDLCVACHGRPHADVPAEAPLWQPSADLNRIFADALQDRAARPPQPFSADAAPSYRYDRPRPHRVDPLPRPDAGTLTCMRCHDGKVAADMFGGLAAPESASLRHPAFFRTGHGGTNHPVGVEYPQFDDGFNPMHIVDSAGQVPLPGGRVQCISCHDPHSEQGLPYMLVRSNAGSALCLTCHRK